MPALQKITTSYSDNEDRLCVAGQDGAGDAVVLWLTQRLANRLVRQFVAWLEDADDGRLAALAPDLRHSWAQEAAARQLEPSAPVRADRAAPALLVTSVDLVREDGRYLMSFHRQGEADITTLTFSTTELRQWLGIVHHLYQAADWPRHAWPAWMEETPREHRQPALLH
jgi:hypothetical protein